MYYLKIINLSVNENDLPYPSKTERNIFSMVNASILKGEIFGILGPSGCGKTIFLKTIAGLIKPCEGQIFKDGVDITFLSPNKRKVAMVFQNIALYPHLKNIENIEFPYVLVHQTENIEREKLKEIAVMLHIDEEKILQKKPAFSSMGEKQRVAIGKALASNPDILLLDEPLSNIEEGLRNEIRHNLKKYLKAREITTLYVSHNQVEIGIFADNIAVMADGRFQQIGSYEELYNDPKTLFVSLYIGEIPSNYLDKNEVKFLTSSRISYFLTIRPEECSISKEEEDSILIAGKVTSIEKFIQHNKKLAMIEYNNKPFGILLPIDYDVNLGQEIEIYIPLKKAKFFDDKNAKIPERIYNLW
jgi:ABC-type sugar transport system ATPase subunit